MMRASVSGKLGNLMITAVAFGAVSASVLAQNADVQLLYDSRYNQIGSAPVTTPYTNIGQAFLTSNGLPITYADVSDPEFDIHSLEDLGGTGNFQALLSQQSSRALLMENVPSGTYEFYWEDDNGDPYFADLEQPFAEGLWPGQIPALTQASRFALTGMDVGQPVTVTVNSFVPSGMASATFGGMFVSVWANGDYGAFVHGQFGVGSGPGGATTSTRTIPAGTLQPGTMYWITWLFQHDVNSPGFPGPGRAKTGFRASTRFAFSTAAPPACPADFNGDGIANSADFFEFLTAFFGSLPSADVNHDSQVNSQDFFDFLADFFEGC